VTFGSADYAAVAEADIAGADQSRPEPATRYRFSSVLSADGWRL